MAHNDEAPGRAAALPVAAPEAPSAPVLSSSADLLGVGPVGWIGAGLLYASVAAAALLLSLTVTPPQPWPETPTVFRVIFEPPPKPAEPAPAPPAAPEPPQTAALPPPEPPPPPKLEPPPPEPALAAPSEPPPPPAATTAPPPPAEPAPAPVAAAPPPPKPAQAPSEAALPLPPPQKPLQRHALAKPRPPRAEARAAPSAPPRSTEEPRVAALPPPTLPLEPPRPISAAAGNPKPVYPAMARRRGLQGRVVLQVEVSVLGAPIRVNVLTSSGHAILDEAAQRAVSQWRFIPATRGGTPVAAAVDVPIQFRLED